MRDFDRVKAVLGSATVVDDLREGERSLSNANLPQVRNLREGTVDEQRLSATERIPVDDALRARVRRQFPVPQELDFRMSAAPPGSSG